MFLFGWSRKSWIIYNNYLVVLLLLSLSLLLLLLVVVAAAAVGEFKILNINESLKFVYL